MSGGRLAAALRGETLELATAADTHALGAELGRELRAGDLVLLTGDLAAGKTTLAQGIGAGLGVRGPITSPTFVIARVHPSLGDGPDLVHVDAYRLGGIEELDDLDLDTDLEAVVTVVEWGHGMAEALSREWLEIVLTRGEGSRPGEGRPGEGRPGESGAGEGRSGELSDEEIAGDEPRWVRVLGHGPRWAGEE